MSRCSIRHAVILAAGRGQRMLPLTKTVAKPMAPYLDTTLIGHGIRQVKEHIENVHITVGYKAATVGQHVIEMGISSVINTDGHPNAWWISHTLLKDINEPVFVLTCDNVTDIDFEALENDYLSLASPAPCMLVPVKPIPELSGDYIHDDQRWVTKVSRDDVSNKYCSGIQVLHPTLIRAYVGEELNDFYDVWNELIRQKRLVVSSVFPTKWTAIDTMSDLERANEEDK